jgi:glycosyltransferase involved in cell wall biosynthesis
MTSKPPKVTVLMPVYNGEKFLGPAIDSILRQTWHDFEFLIIDDGSSDGSMDIARSYDDPRIKIVQNTKNLGIIETLNKGIAAATGCYIARMDSDDVSLPRRLEKQVAFMDSHPEIGLCGTWIRLKGPSLRRVHRNPVDPDEIKATLFFRDIMAHPTVMMRTEWIRRFGLRYDPSFPHAEDWELWQRMTRYFPLANIPEVLLEYRLNPGGISATKREDQAKTIRDIYRRSLGALGIEATEDEINLHFAVSSYGRPSESSDYPFRVERWIERLWEANGKHGLYPEPAFSCVLADRWAHICLATPRSERWRSFNQSRLSSMLKLDRGALTRFFFLHLVGWGKIRETLKTIFNERIEKKPQTNRENEAVRGP